MPKIQVRNDVTGGTEEIDGSDNRFNVSSRSDSRGYYNSRDEGQAYSLPFTHTAASDGEHSFYLKNTSTIGKTLVVSWVDLNCDTAGARFKLWFVSGTAGDGSSVTPTNLNRASSSNAATADALESAGGTAISGLSNDALIDYVMVGANEHHGLNTDDRVRLGQGDAIALELDENAAGTADVTGVCFFFFE